MDCSGNPVPKAIFTAEAELREAGDVWAEHVLENAKAYIMSFIYIAGTVTSGYAPVTAASRAAGLDTDWVFYISKFEASTLQL
jgi:hypothetical protein